MKKILLFTIFFFLYLNPYSQPQFQWLKNYKMRGCSFAVDSTGNIYAAGFKGDTIHILKYNSSGNLIWHRYDTIHTSGYGICAAADKQGDIYYTAETYYALGGTNYTWIISAGKYDSTGSKKWLKHFTRGFMTRPVSVTLDNSGNVYVAGYGVLIIRNVYITMKFNPQGDTLWTAIYDNNISGSMLNAMCLDANNNVYVTGNSIFQNSNGNYATVKYNSSGVQQWVSIYDINQSSDGAFAITSDKNGYCYVTGGGYIRSGYEITGTVKYNPNGDSVWTRLYYPPSNLSTQYGQNILLDTSLNVYVSGRGSDSLQSSYQIFKYNSQGNLLWRVNDTSATFVNSSVLDKCSNIFSTGSTWNRFYTNEVDKNGIKLWSSFYPQNPVSGMPYTAYKALIYNQSSLYICGSSLDSTVIIKYNVSTGINNSVENIITDFKLYQNYPNPFNPSSNIKYQIKNNALITIKVFDILGKEIATLVNEKQKPGTYEVSFDGSNSPSGIYFYSLYVDGVKIDTKKLILLK